MEELKIEKKFKQQKKQAEVLPTTEAVQDDAVEGCNDYATDGSLPLSTFRQKAHKNVVVRKRSQTVTSANEPVGSTKSLLRGKSVTQDTMKRSSTFYTTTMDVTTPFVLPVMEVDTLVVTNRSPSQLLDLMTTV